MTTESADTFVFAGHQWSPEERRATFTYHLHHKGEKFIFTEVLTFPQPIKTSEIPQELLKAILDNLLLVLGISYYKLYCPKNIELVDISLNKEQAAFWETLYTKGLGEFFYKNKIAFRGLISFPVSKETTLHPVSFPRENRSLVGIGGGKDSIVTVELLKKHNKQCSGFVLNSYPLQNEVTKLMSIDSLVVQRQLDPQLFELNKREDTYNGHIPISSQYAFIGLFCAMVYNYRYVIVSNEHSSNYGNVSYHGMEVNHQWSKSFEFEKLFQKYVKHFITPDVVYFSLLRPWTEISVVKRFIQYPQYFSHFSSCNSNFKLTGKESNKLWCGNCAKCAFAFVMLAAFLPQKTVFEIFGQNLFEKESLLQTYKKLLGISAIKPFDCVGTPDEVRVAFYLAMKKSYEGEPIMKFFKEQVLPTISNIEQLQKEVFNIENEHAIPYEFQEVIKE